MITAGKHVCCNFLVVTNSSTRGSWVYLHECGANVDICVNGDRNKSQCLHHML